MLCLLRMLTGTSLHVWKSVNTFWPKTQPMHIEKQQFHLGTWEILLPEKLSLNEQHQATLEKLIYLNVQNFCPGGRHTRSKMHHNSISVLWWEKATELIKKRERHFNGLILLFPKHHYLEEGHGSQHASLTFETPLLIWISSRCPTAIRQLTFHCNQYRTSKRSGPVSWRQESEVRGLDLREGERPEEERQGPSNRRGQNADLPTFCEGLGLEWSLIYMSNLILVTKHSRKS